MGLWLMPSSKRGGISRWPCFRSALKGELPLSFCCLYHVPAADFVRRWIFYSAVNSITPQISLNLGWETTAWHNATRQMTYQVPSIVASILIV